MAVYCVVLRGLREEEKSNLAKFLVRVDTFEPSRSQLLGLSVTVAIYHNWLSSWCVYLATLHHSSVRVTAGVC